MQKKNLVGLGVDEAKKLLTDAGVNFRLTFYQSDKLKSYDTQLVVAVRSGDPVELIIADFKFNV
ncbi:MAG: PASTA domain-containing protein [Clostridia bacterium]|nr:PASTA domain-containing protein [Clostridia bacterium]